MTTQIHRISQDTHPEIASEHREMTAPLAAPAQGETPRTDAAAIRGSSTAFPRASYFVDSDVARRLERELNEAKTLYAASLDTLKDMSAQVAQLTGAQDRMDAEIAMLTADLFRATRERDQARQDLEERCAENDRERAAHLQAYQAVTRERDEARQWSEQAREAMLLARDRIGNNRTSNYYSGNMEAEAIDWPIHQKLFEAIESHPDAKLKPEYFLRAPLSYPCWGWTFMGGGQWHRLTEKPIPVRDICSHYLPDQPDKPNIIPKRGSWAAHPAQGMEGRG